MKEHYDVIIVGTGAAGLYCALNLPEKMKILLITKQEADQSDSFLAQGGICMLRGEDDYENYFEDTMRAGHYENNKRAVDLMIRSSNDIIRDLLRYHVDFTRDGLGNLAFTREGAHSQPRILFHEDITGKEITQTLLTAAKIKENIEICEYMTMVDLISKDNTVCGIIAMDRNDQAFPVYSQYVVLACGGIGGLFKNSTNFSHIAGDGVGIAMKHHVEMENLDYIQIHPTTLYSKKTGRRFLVSESVRGEGALLYDKNGQRFTNELQPRDLLSQKISAQMEKDGTEFVWEDMRPEFCTSLSADFRISLTSLVFPSCVRSFTYSLYIPVPAVLFWINGRKTRSADRLSPDFSILLARRRLAASFLGFLSRAFSAIRCASS